MYSLTDENGKPCSQSMAISNSLESLAEFEKETDNQLWNWLSDFKKLRGGVKKFTANPVTLIIGKTLIQIKRKFGIVKKEREEAFVKLQQAKDGHRPSVKSYEQLIERQNGFLEALNWVRK